jgi:ribonuclease HII
MILGVDEVNFSPSLAGDCVVVALAARQKVKGVKDSKVLLPSKRISLFRELQKKSIYSASIATVQEINETGVYLARNNAIISAVDMLISRLRRAGISDKISVGLDGYFSAEWLGRFHTLWDVQVAGVLDGDRRVYEISAASVMAKVIFDALMTGYGKFWPDYGLETDHGSPSEKHKIALRKFGPSPVHRIGGVYAKEWSRKILGGRHGE